MITVRTGCVTQAYESMIELGPDCPKESWGSALAHELAHIELGHLSMLPIYHTSNTTRLRMEIDAWAEAARRGWKIDLEDAKLALSKHMDDMTLEEIRQVVSTLTP